MPKLPLLPHETGNSERDIQARCVELLWRCGWFVLEMDKAAMGKTKHKGAFEQGFPDVVALKNGLALVFETKSASGVVRPDQRLMHARLATHGITVHVPRSEHDLLPLLVSPRR